MFQDEIDAVKPVESKGKAKRKAPATPPQKHASRSKRTKPTVDGLFAVAGAMESLQGTFDNTSTTPQRQSRAIQAVEESGELSDDELADAIGLFQDKPQVATAYLAIKGSSVRSLFLQKQLARQPPL